MLAVAVAVLVTVQAALVVQEVVALGVVDKLLALLDLLILVVVLVLLALVVQIIQTMQVKMVVLE
jgi:hypothetical protein